MFFFGIRFFKILFFWWFCSFKTVYLNDLQVSLVRILEDYKEARRQKEEEKKRYRVNKNYVVMHVAFWNHLEIKCFNFDFCGI